MKQQPVIKTYIMLISSVLLGGLWCNTCTAKEQVVPQTLLAQKLNEPEQKISRRKRRKQIVNFDYNNEDLVDIINRMAKLKQVNVLLPSGDATIKSKVTLHIEQKLTIDEAWEVLLTLLEVAGYSILQKGLMYNIIKVDKDIAREPLPLYIAVAVDELPDSDERIRYLHYLSNIQAITEQNSELMAILKEILPTDSNYQVDPNTNALIVAGKASDVKSVMQIISAIDQSEYQEKPQIIRLRHVPAELVANLFREQILKSGRAGPRYNLARQQPSTASYFAKHLKIMPYSRTNSLIVLGKKQAVERVKHFIFKYIDVELASGKSVLHTYSLQYLEAQKFAPILNRIVTSSRSGGTGQSRGGAKQSATERFFEEVIIQADAAGSDESGQFFGGNKLIIAARNDDWKRIKQLIEQLDTPQPQVIIEILIADLTLQDTQLLGSLTRNPDVIPLHGCTSFQSAQIQRVILDEPTNGSVASDLLNKVFESNTLSAAGVATPGSTIVSLSDSDGRTWSIFQLLNLFNHRKVLSHPHIIATDHHEASILIGESRLVADEGTSSGSQSTAKKKSVDAKLDVKITPHISSGNSVTLKIDIDIDEFTNPNALSGEADKVTRKVQTIANVKNKSILALGGLTRIDTQKDRGQTPILGQLPIIGWFFKQKSNQLTKTSLTVFIQPTIVLPRLRGGVGEYTKDYIKVANRYTTDGTLFENLKDPITRWLFKSGKDTAKEAVDDFVSKDEFKQESAFVERKLKSKQFNGNNDNGYNNRGILRPENGLQGIKEQTANIMEMTENTKAPLTDLDPRAEQLKQLVQGKQNPLLKNKTQKDS